MSLLIKNGYCLGEKEGHLDVLVEDDRIVSLEKGIEAEVDTVIDADNCIVLPAFCNAHTHLAMSLFRGMADDLNLMEWLNNHIFPAEAKYVDSEMVYWCSSLSMLEMIRSGTACFADMYFYEEQVARAAMRIGMKAMIGEGILDFKTPDASSAREAIEKTKALKREFESETIKVSYAPHSTYTLSEESLRLVADAADDGSPVQIHVNESSEEITTVMRTKGKRPMDVLKETGLLDKDIYLVHCVASSDDDIRMMKAKGCSVVNVPQSNLKLASGIAPMYKMERMGIDIFIGTDGPASNNNLDIIEELRVMSLIQKALSRDSTVVGAKKSFVIGTNSLFENSGKLSAGYKADIVVISTDSFEAIPMYNPYSYLAYAANSRDVRCVIIDGKVVYKDGEFTTVDKDEIVFEVKRIAKKLGAVF